MTLNLFFRLKLKTFFFELLLPITKPIVVGIIYQLPSQLDFLEIINNHFSKLDTNNNEIYILSILTLTSILTTRTFFKKNLLQNQTTPSDIKKYFELCTMFGLKQLIEVPTYLTCSSSTIIDQIRTIFPVDFYSKISLM